MDIVIRPGEIRDCPIIAEAVAMAIGEESVREYCGVEYRKVLEEVIAAGDTQYSYLNALVAEVDGRPAGAVIGYDGAMLSELRDRTLSIIYRERNQPTDFPDETEAGEFYVDSIGVLPQFRGYGIGHRLLKEIRSRAFSGGHKTIGLIVDKENPKAEKLYQSIGFKRVGTKIFFGHHMWHLQSAVEDISEMTEKEKMLSGMCYSAVDPELLEELNFVKTVIYKYNNTPPSDTEDRKKILKDLLGYTGDNDFIINQPFYCDYGKQISIGKRFFANFNLTILDEARVTIGDDCFIGPNVSIYTACHSTDPIERNSRREWAEPVKIGDNVWIGGSVTILPGVTIGSNVTIGAGSVVTKDIPDGVVAAGNPCKVLRYL